MTHFIDGQWCEGEGSVFQSKDPAYGRMLWQGAAATAVEVEQAVASARKAFDGWQALTLAERTVFLESFIEILTAEKATFANSIAQETGKPVWESLTEVTAMIAKLAISIEAYHERTGSTESEMAGFNAALRHKPHGVVAVFGPYNFPGHLPNGHIIPALLAGNTVVFKPSELTPAVGEKMVKLWQQAGLPKGVLNLLQGQKKTGEYLANHADLDGLFFTGSSTTGQLFKQIHTGNANKILALEMGGNNPLIVNLQQESEINAALYHTVQSAYLSAGQRCTCARRLIIVKNPTSDLFLQKLVQVTQKLKVGGHEDTPEPFMGPVISFEAAQKLLIAWQDLIEQGAKPLVGLNLLQQETGLLSPGLIDVTGLNLEDVEHFGPLLKIIQVANFDEALAVANQTRFGLSAGLLSNDSELYQRFFRKIRAGIVNWNRPLTGASSKAPFGGVGCSGNHRPSAYYAADYCSYPVASLEAEQLVLPNEARVAPGGLSNLLD